MCPSHTDFSQKLKVTTENLKYVLQEWFLANIRGLHKTPANINDGVVFFKCC